MKKSCFIVFLGLAMPMAALAQVPGMYLTLAYEGGMFTHPGLSIGLESSLGSKKSGECHCNEFRWGGKAGFYAHRRYNTGAFVLPGIRWLRTSDGGFQYGVGFNAGYLRAFIPNTYQVSDDGSIAQKHFFGTNHLAIVPSFSLGKSLADKSIPIEYFFKSQLIIQRPYFEGRNIYYILSAGINYKLK